MSILNFFRKYKEDGEISPKKPMFAGDLAVLLQPAQPKEISPDNRQIGDKTGVVVFLSFMTQEAQDSPGWTCVECGTRNVTSDYCEVCGLQYTNKQ